MAYQITPKQLRQVNDVELAFGTQKLLPAEDDIPAEFWKSNEYTALAENLQFGRDIGNGEIGFREGFSMDDASALHKCVLAHLISHGPKHEHKIAGVAYLISLVCELSPGKPTA